MALVYFNERLNVVLSWEVNLDQQFVVNSHAVFKPRGTEWKFYVVSCLGVLRTNALIEIEPLCPSARFISETIHLISTRFGIGYLH
jgi:hypothetical protein